MHGVKRKFLLVFMFQMKQREQKNTHFSSGKYTHTHIYIDRFTCVQEGDEDT